MTDVARAPLPIEAVRAMTGLELMRGMIDGSLPGAPIGGLMNMRGVEAGPGYIVFEGMPGPEHYNPIGSVHGGYAATLLDSCMGCAVHTVLGAGIGYTSIDINITFVRAITHATGPVTARGEVINVGRRVGTVRGTLTDAAGKVLAHGTSSCLIFEIK
ncbi:PaaI family thioesterase [Polymorphobacter sp. PAMC 29334]|uniref:PaaI family thioesterase n=1 Tax=Polymorphobacter sp. PAMC 29334 TaxID=2862331 RepID=UPI001C684698|nr:PaaI family thioesterase [Polymorphobacter sp. PAMC 29334]QYE36515.1 PaaI family thioesterase [Polymorphobacter sp. PAMC 29334]